MKYETSAEERERYERTGHLCEAKACPGPKQPPELWLGTESGQLIKSAHLIIDNREDPGLSLGKGAQVADYNNDGVFRFFRQRPRNWWR